MENSDVEVSQSKQEREEYLSDFVSIQSAVIAAKSKELSDFVSKAVANPDKRILKQHFTAWEGDINYGYSLEA